MQDLHEACCPKGRLPKLPTELLNWCANDDTPKISSACSSCLGVLFDTKSRRQQQTLMLEVCLGNAVPCNEINS